MGFDLSEIFDVFFGGGGFGARRTSRGPRRSRVHRGGDSHAALTLTFEQSVFGVDREIDIETLETCERCAGSGAEPGTSPTRCSRCNGAGEIQNVQRSIFGTVMTSAPCPTCEGTGEEIVTKCSNCNGDGRARKRQTMTVEVPAGVTDGLELRIAGGGHAGRAGGPPGDLYVALDVQPHPVFERRGQDLFAVLEVPMTQAALGAEVEVPTLDGTEKVKLDAGTGNGQLVRLKGRGVPHLGRKARGDLFLSVHVTTPEPRSREERKLMEQIAQLRREPTGKGPHPATLRRPTLE
jgi:molecular chaperone DnaJ